MRVFTAGLVSMAMGLVWYIAVIAWAIIGNHWNEPATPPWVIVNTAGVLGLMLVGLILLLIGGS